MLDLTTARLSIAPTKHGGFTNKMWMSPRNLWRAKNTVGVGHGFLIAMFGYQRIHSDEQAHYVSKPILSCIFLLLITIMIMMIIIITLIKFCMTHITHENHWDIPVVPARCGAEVAFKDIYIYKTFLIYRTCMRRAPAKPVRACTLRNWCLVSHVTF